MSMKYVRDMYDVPAARGMRMEVQQTDGSVRRGTITSATHYVFIRLDGEKHSKPYHPTDPALTYLIATMVPTANGGTQ